MKYFFCIVGFRKKFRAVALKNGPQIAQIYRKCCKTSSENNPLANV
jgi:hypothetical protein